MLIRFRVRFWLLAGVLLLCCARASAAGVRDFSPDRPSRSDTPFTVPASYFQAEADFANYTNTGDQFQALDPTLKYGLNDRVDGEIQFGGFVSQRSAGARAESFGDIVIRLKLSVLGDDGGDLSIAVIPYAKAPTAGAPIGNGEFEGGVNMPFLVTLPLDIGLTIEPEMAILKNALNTRRQASFTGIINLGRKITGDLSSFVEMYDQIYSDRQSPGPTVTFDTGLSYAVTTTLQLDLGANFGLNGATPGVNIYSGIAARF